MLSTCQSSGKCLIRMQSLPLTSCPSSGPLSKSSLQSSCYSFTACNVALSGVLALGLELWQRSRQTKCAVSHPKLSTVLTIDPATGVPAGISCLASFYSYHSKTSQKLSCVCWVWPGSVMPSCHCIPWISRQRAFLPAQHRLWHIHLLRSGTHVASSGSLAGMGISFWNML